MNFTILLVKFTFPWFIDLQFPWFIDYELNELNELNEFYYSQNRESSHVGRFIYYFIRIFKLFSSLPSMTMNSIPNSPPLVQDATLLNCAISIQHLPVVVQCTSHSRELGKRRSWSSDEQLDRVVISLEALVRSSAPHTPPTTLRAFFDSPGWSLSDRRFEISKK